MNISAIDLNLLKIFAALLEAPSVSAAAKQAGVSQPAMSHGLKRLRAAFDDPLFVRTTTGISPTPHATRLAPRIREAMDAAARVFGVRDEFDPEQANMRFTIASTDFLDHILLPRLLPILQARAPGITVVTRPLNGTLPKLELEEGSLDLATAGFFGDLPEGFYRQSILKEDYACLVRVGHPRIQEKLGLREYLNEGHLLVSPQGDLKGAVDQVLTARGLSRKVVAGVSSFQLPPWIVAESDLIITLPTRLARIYEKVLPLRLFPPPIPIPGFTIVAVWHARNHESRAHQWMRKLIATCCDSAPQGTALQSG